MSRPEVLVIGAGVSGLTTAVCLAEAGLSVRVRTRELPKETTSCAAGAVWSPYLTEDERMLGWSERSRLVFEGLARERDTGVRLVRGLEAARTPTVPPEWATDLAGFQVATVEELPDGFASGWWYTAAILDMPAYLIYLTHRLGDRDVKVEAGAVSSLADAVADTPIAVNCTGIGARDLVPDPDVVPTRGQLVVVENPGVEWFFAEHDESPEPTYFLPQGDHIVLGGTLQPGQTDLVADHPTSVAIRDRCAAIEPVLARAAVLDHRVGLRPTRSRVRFERVDVGGRHVIHNYGHGGAGVTASWGCAQDVLRLVDEI
jgi:D-amino-acid oxidase